MCGTAWSAAAERPGNALKVVLQERNRGKGAAVRTALARVTGDIVLIQDADLEYDPAEYPRLIQPILDGHADVVYGSRFVAVGTGGAIYVSTDGVTWQAAQSGTTNDLYAITFAASIATNTLAVGYTAVGAAGVNLTSY